MHNRADAFGNGRYGELNKRNQQIDEIEKKWDKLTSTANADASCQVQYVSELEQLFTAVADFMDTSAAAGDMKMVSNLAAGLVPKMRVLSGSIERMIAATNEMNTNLSAAYDEIYRLKKYKVDYVAHISAMHYANAGDYILAKSLRKLIEHSRGEIEWESEKVSDPVTELSLEVYNRSRGLIIGGGGLLLSDSNPNSVSGWQWACPIDLMEKIEVPIYVLGVGYNRFRGQDEFSQCFTDNLRCLVRKSSIFGLRNYGSIKAVRQYLPDELAEKVIYHPCATTVISKLYEIPAKQEGCMIGINCAFDRADRRFGGEENMNRVIRSLAETVRNLKNRYHATILCYIHCMQDEVVINVLRKEGVEATPVNLIGRDEQYMIEWYAKADLVLGMRGHSQMVAYGVGTPAISLISHDKMRWFLDDIDHAEWGVEMADEHFGEILMEKAVYMLEHSAQIKHEIEESKEKLWEILNANVAKMNL